MKMYVMNLGKPTKVAKLNEAMAIELGASLMGEIIIFSVAGGCIMLEYVRQQAKESKKEEAREQLILNFTEDIQALYDTSMKQQDEITYLSNVVNDLAKRSKIKLPEKKPPGLEDMSPAPKPEGASVVHHAITFYEKDSVDARTVKQR